MLWVLLKKVSELNSKSALNVTCPAIQSTARVEWLMFLWG